MGSYPFPFGINFFSIHAKTHFFSRSRPSFDSRCEPCIVLKKNVMMMVAFITIKSSLVPLIEGLCAQIYFRFEISVVCSHFLLFFFVKEKTCKKKTKRQLVQTSTCSPAYIYIQVKTAGKWQKCNLVSGKASVASDMGWL